MALTTRSRQVNTAAFFISVSSLRRRQPEAYAVPTRNSIRGPKHPSAQCEEGS